LNNKRVERRLAAVLAADVAGYSRLMEADEEGTLARLKAVRKAIVDPAIASHRGHIVKTTGDGILLEFASAVDAVRGAVETQRSMAGQNSAVPSDQRIEFRIGIHVGDIIFDDNDIFGDGVNIAARLEGIAEPGGVCMSDDAYRQVRGKLEITCNDMGLQPLKNIAEPMRAWRIRLTGQTPAVARPGLAASQSRPLPLPDKPSIAVLPFENMSGDPEQEYFADGIVEDIITALSRFKALFVIARNSSFIYKRHAVDVKRVGSELGVRYVLEGSVRKAANRVRITGQLIDTTSGGHLWANRFDGGVGDIFDLQDQVAESIVGAIAPAVEKAEIERAKRKPTGSLDAYDHYLRGLASSYQRADRQSGDEALRLFNKAIELDPGFASAYARAALCYSWADVIPLAASGYTLAFVARDLVGGAAMVDRALVLNSNLAEAWFWGGWMKNWLGEPEIAIERFTRGMRLNPLDPSTSGVHAGMSHAHFFLRHYDDAIAWAAMALQEIPDFQPAIRMDAAGNAMAGRLEQAHEAVAHLRQLNPALRVSNLKDVLGPYRRPQDLSLYEEGLRKAGLPE
jgi:TolB-like protein/class 3 adenylate cyclase